MLKYKLCKKLKDAGLPQIVRTGERYYKDFGNTIEVNRFSHTEFLWENIHFYKHQAKIPTILELIKFVVAKLYLKLKKVS